MQYEIMSKTKAWSLQRCSKLHQIQWWRRT